MTTLNFANDLGYGSMKGAINDYRIQIPSVLAVKRDQDSVDPLDITQMSESDADRYIENFLHHLDVSIQSNSIKKHGRFLVGQAAVDSHLTLQSFDVNDQAGKSSTDLAMILTLSTLAGYAVQDFYSRNEHLPKTTLDIHVNMVTALPILEGLTNNTKDLYKARYLDRTHTVTFYNFDQTLNVNLTFDKVGIALEGQAAQYAIWHANDELKGDLFNDFADNYPVFVKDYGITADDLIDNQDVMGIDIGEGTTDIAIFEKGRINENASSSIKTGYGHVLQGAIDELQSQQYNVGSRAEIKELLNDDNLSNPFLRARVKPVMQAVENQKPNFATQIVDKVSQALHTASGSIQVIYVYGGGATPMANDLRSQLADKTKQFTNGLDIPVVFLPSKYSQTANELGLNLILGSLVGGDK